MKTLKRKDIASSAAPKTDDSNPATSHDSTLMPSEISSMDDGVRNNNSNENGEFSSKAQVMTLMTTDVDRCSEFAMHIFTLVGMYTAHTNITDAVDFAYI